MENKVFQKSFLRVRNPYKTCLKMMNSEPKTQKGLRSILCISVSGAKNHGPQANPGPIPAGSRTWRVMGRARKSFKLKNLLKNFLKILKKSFKLWNILKNFSNFLCKWDGFSSGLPFSRFEGPILGEKGMQKCWKYLTFNTKNHMADSWCKIPYKTNGKWRLFEPKIEKGL